jgi:hypothetical protein
MTTHPPDFRALCAELVAAYNSYSYADGGDAADRMKDAIDAARAALNAPPLAPISVGEDTRYEFSVFDREDEEQAGGSAQTLAEALREGSHYMSVYSQDQEFGPYRLELRRVETIPLPEVQE